MLFLAKFADKYDIKGLHRDIQVVFMIHWLTGFQRFIVTLLYRGSLQPQMRLWVFAVCYGFCELENFCLVNEQLKREILSKLTEPKSGVGYFLNEAQLLLSDVNKLIAAILSRGVWAEVLRRKHKEE